MARAVEQFDLLTDDPRCEEKRPKAIQHWKPFRALQNGHWNPLTR